MNIDKTVVFTVDDKSIIVADLDAALRKQFEILDAYRQELANIAIKYEMANTAVQVKMMQLQEIIRQKLNPPKAPDEVTEAPASNE